MSYRGLEKKRPTVCDVTTLSDIHIINGASAEFAIPCWYNLAPRPAPDPCKAAKAPEPVLEAIRLLEEGYGPPIVAFDEPLEGLSYDAWIEPEEEHVIRLVLRAVCPDAISETQRRRMSLMITRTTNGRRYTDVVLRSDLTIEASPISLDLHVFLNGPVTE